MKAHCIRLASRTCYAVFAVAGLLSMSGCSGTSTEGNRATTNVNDDDAGQVITPPNENNDPEEPGPEVMIISDDPSADADGRIVLQPGGPVPQPGAALITGGGSHLYRIETVEHMADGSLSLGVSQGSLAQLGITGEFAFRDALDVERVGKTTAREAGVDANLQILDFSLPFSTTMALTDNGDITATVEGVFALDGEFHLAFDVGLRGLNSFSSYVGGDGRVDLGVALEALSGVSLSREQVVPGAAYTTYFSGVIPGPLGVPIPIIVELTVELLIGFEADLLPGSIDTAVNAAAELKVGADYDAARPQGARWASLSTSGFDWGYEEPVVCFEGAGSLQAYLRPHFEVQLYSAVGPTFDIEPFGTFEGTLAGCLGDATVAYEATLSAGALAYAKVKADILDRFVVESPRLTVFDVSRQLASWRNTPSPSDEPVPPITFSLPLDTDTPSHIWFDQNPGADGWCRSWATPATEEPCACPPNCAGTYDGHTGTDFAAGVDTPVYAARSGKILVKKDGRPDGCYPCGGTCHVPCDDFDKQRGNHIILDHGDGFRTSYRHLEKGTLTCKEKGGEVECGEYLGKVGKSGLAAGYHLHFGANFGAPQDQPIGTPFDPYDGYPYWGTDSLDARAPRASFWARRDAHGAPVKTCEGPPPPECLGDEDCLDAGDSCIECVCVAAENLVVTCQASADPSTIIPPGGEVTVTWEVTEVTGSNGPWDFYWGDAYLDDPLGGDAHGTTNPLEESYDSAGTYTAFVKVIDRITGSDGDASCDIVLTAAPTEPWRLEVNVTGDGSGTITASITPDDPGNEIDGCTANCSDTFVDGTEVTLTANPDLGACVDSEDNSADCVFGGWSGGTCSGNALSCSFTMDRDKIVTARFDHPSGEGGAEEVTLSFSPGIMNLGPHPAGQSLTSGPLIITAQSSGDLEGASVCLESFNNAFNSDESIYKIVADRYDDPDLLLRCSFGNVEQICVEDSVDPSLSRQCGELEGVGESYQATFRVKIPDQLSIPGLYYLLFEVEGEGLFGSKYLQFNYSP